MDKAVLGEDIILKSKGQQRYSYCYIADAVSGLLKLLLDGQDGEAYNISNDDDGLTLGEYAEYIASLANLKVRYEIENNESVSKATFALLDGNTLRSLRNSTDLRIVLLLIIRVNYIAFLLICILSIRCGEL